ncbi:hypothetical protein KM043_016768 [Ampulex compressa]|nr:hypothetical protein KM043_016768 [Ampulex compressa]
MQTQPEIHTISRIAPPSYAEAMAQSASMKDNPHVPPQQPPDQRPQVSSCPTSLPAYQYGGDIYSGVGTHPACSSVYMPTAPSRPPAPPLCIVHTDPVDRRFKKRICTPKIALAVLCVFAFITILRWVLW